MNIVKEKPYKIPLFFPYVSKKAIKEVVKVLRSKFIGQGPEIPKFEQKFRQKFKAKYAVAVSSCTASLHLAYILAGVKEGDEVVGPLFTCSATWHPVLQQKAIPVFVDIKDDFTLDPDDLERKITPKTKAIVVMHYAGCMCDMDRIMEIARKHNLPVIEDAAQAVGAYYNGKKARGYAGTIGDFGCFSGRTLITTDKGEKRIKDIKEGERVLVENGKYEEVIKKFERDYKGDWVKLYFGKKDSMTRLVATGEHPIKVYREGRDIWIPIRDIEKTDKIYVLTKKCEMCDNKVPFYHKLCWRHNPAQSEESRKKLSIIKNQGKNTLNSYLLYYSKHYYNDIIPASVELEKQGFRVIPIGKAVPDVIAIKDNKVFAYEIENKVTPKISKVDNYREVRKYFDDIIWITKNLKPDWRKRQYEIIEDLARVHLVEIKKWIKKNSEGGVATHRVYNLEVENNHTYFARKVLVHNCFSFQAIKYMTTVDGGMLTCKKADDFDKAKRIRWFGIDRDLKIKKNWQQFEDWERREMTYDVWEVGYKYHMNNFNAVMGMVHMQELNKILGHQKALSNLYRKLLKNVKGIKFLPQKSGDTDWLMTVLIDRRDDFAKKIKTAGIETNTVHIRSDVYAIFKPYAKGEYPKMDEAELKYLCLPLHSKVKADDVQKICRIIKKGW